MNDPTSEKEVLDTYLKKIAENIYFAIESISILRTIDKNIDDIIKVHFEHFFIPLQRPLINDVILALNKIFEERSAINIKKIQNYLESNQKTVRIEQNCIDSLQKYRYFDFSKLKIYEETVKHELELEPFKGHIYETKYKAFTLKDFLKILNENINKLNEEYQNDLKALKELRDKNIAHSDKKPIHTKTTWDKIDNLIEFIKEYVDILSWVYLTTAWSGDNSEAFSLSGAEKTSYSLNRLLEKIKPQNSKKLKRIGLALSGGGFRAAVFHLGVLKYLAEKKRLEEIVHISTVSGGSIAMGLIYKLSGNKFPTSDEYLNEVFPMIEKYFVEENFGLDCLIELAKPTQWVNLFNRANIVADVLYKKWGITCNINDLPQKPIWEICSTTNETGKSWRFTQTKMGDYKFGYSNSFLKLSSAVAASAAFPGIIGRFKLKTDEFKWFTYKDWKSGLTENIEPKYPILHLSDGGVYDNLATEPFFKKLGEELADTIDYLIVCDASKDLEEKESSHFLRMIKRSKRLIEIATDQIRMLRTRAIHNYLGEYKGKEGKGLFIKMGQYFKERNQDDIEKLKKIETSIFKLKKDEFDLLIHDAYIAAKTTYAKYG